MGFYGKEYFLNEAGLGRGLNLSHNEPTKGQNSIIKNKLDVAQKQNTTSTNNSDTKEQETNPSASTTSTTVSTNSPTKHGLGKGVGELGNNPDKGVKKVIPDKKPDKED